jgi:lysophospholipase L1-like esterase
MEFNLKPTDLWDNGYTGSYAKNQGEYYFSNFASSAKFRTTATSVEVTAYNNEPLEVASIGVRVNNRDYTNAACPFRGLKTLTIPLPPGAKIVELVEGGQDKAETLATGTFLVRAVFNAFTELIPPSFSRRAVIYGDSISAGAHAAIRPFQGWSVLFRRYYGDSTIIEGWGSRALKDDCFDAAHRQDFVNRLAGYGPQAIILFIGTNDYGIPNNWNALSFGDAYGDFLDKLHLAIPEASVYCYTPLIRRWEGPNEYGNSLDDYRSAIHRAASSRPWAIYRDGKTILSLADMAEDGTHPTTAGHARLALAVKNDSGL